MKILIFLLTLSFIHINVTAERLENPCGVMTPQVSGDWGKHAIYLPKDVNLPIRNESNEIVCFLSRNDFGQFVLTKDEGCEQIEFNRNDFIYAGYFQMPLLKVYDKQERYLVFNQTSKTTYWIDSVEIKNYKGQCISYKDILSLSPELPKELFYAIRGSALGVNETKSCINVRTGDSVKDSKIDCVPDNTKIEAHNTFKILEIKDDWANVEIHYYRLDKNSPEEDPDCLPLENYKNLTGWINLIDPKGFPNLWFAIND